MLQHIPVDHLTGFFSREALKEFLQENMIEAATERKNLCVTLVDLDHFKRFNDRFGHIFGDDILRYAAEVLRSTIGETSNYFFRYGGDEFVIISTDKKPGEVVRMLKKYNRFTYYTPSLEGGKAYKIAMSAGVAVFPRDAQTVELLIRKADQAMYFSKRHGRRAVTMAGSMVYGVVFDVIMLFTVALAGVYLVSYLFVNPNMVGNICSFLGKQAKRIKIVRKLPIPKDIDNKNKEAGGTFDIIRLQDGKVYEGRVLVESLNEVIISTRTASGEYIMSIPTSKIDSIKRAEKGR